MTVDASSPLRTDYHGTTYFFCNPGCLRKFQSDPAKYLSAGAAHDAMGDPDAIYTCPMHPEVRHKGPGACPI
jgi:Cu+-exporting ATPase